MEVVGVATPNRTVMAHRKLFPDASSYLYSPLSRNRRAKNPSPVPQYHYLHPMSMTQMEKIFSELVFGDTFPNPTLVRLLKVKYRAVTYLSLMEGPEPGGGILYM